MRIDRCNGAGCGDDLVYALPSYQVTARMITRLREYVRMWRDASLEHGPFALTADNFDKVLVDMQCDLIQNDGDSGEIVDLEGLEFELSSDALGEPGALRYWFRDTFFDAGPFRPTVRVRPEARHRYRYIASVIAANDPIGAELYGFRPELE